MHNRGNTAQTAQTYIPNGPAQPVAARADLQFPNDAGEGNLADELE